tara:strand:+ start:2175 stop:4166 length:1992 start_codon:yes stop_codon:yes gene_type:complete
MANYIKIRDLTAYPANAQHTGVYSGDMFAMALNTTGPGSPHAIDGTQRASVRQVIESYNTTVAQNSQPPAGAAPGPSNQPGVVKDEDGTILDGGPSLTPSTFASYVTVGGGLDYKETCITNPDDATQTICTYGLEVATSASSTTFYAVVSGGAVAPADGYQITSNGWISGRFPRLRDATAWTAANISSAKNLYFLIAGDITEEISQNKLNLQNSSIETVNFLDYGSYALTYDQNTNVAANGNSRWVTSYASYEANDIVQFTGTDAGYIGDWNLYRRKVSSSNTNPPETNGVVASTQWERMTPAMTTGLSAGTSADPNGFMVNNPLFANRASITFNPSVTATNGQSYGWFDHGGETRFINLKLIFNDINNTDASEGYYGGAGISRIFRKEGNHFMSIGPGVEMHLHGKTLSQVFQLIRGANFRVYGNAPFGINSVPDAWNKTGSAGVNCPMPALYISASGITGSAVYPVSTGIGCFVAAEAGSEALLGNEYWASQATYTRNTTFENSRMQWGSGQNNVTAMVEAISASLVGGNTNMAISPTTTFNPGGVNLSITGYSALGHEGLGRDAANIAYPNIAPIAARQFISNNTELTSASGAQGTSAGTTWVNTAWVGNIGNNIASGDDFSSSKYAAPYARTSVVTPATDSKGLGLYERYPDSLPPVGR